MTAEFINLTALLPELLLLGGACVVLLLDVFQVNPGQGRLAYWLSLIVLVLASGITLANVGVNTGPALSGHFVKDALGDALKFCSYMAVLMSFVYSHVRHPGLVQGEFFVLGLFAVLGMSVMISAGSLITVFMGLELFSIPLYTMVALPRESAASHELAMRYFIRGSIASGVLLYGMSMLYGATGNLNLVQISEAMQRLITTEVMSHHQLLLVLGLIFVLVGISFKFSALPLYMWMVNIDDNIPQRVTLSLAILPKLVAFTIMIRLLIVPFNALIDPWQQVAAIMMLLFIAIVGTLRDKIGQNI